MIYFILVLLRDLTVLHCPGAGDVGLEGEVVLGEGAGVDDLAAQVLCCEGFKLVSSDDEVREGVEGEGAVIVPEDRTGMEGEGGEVALAGNGLGKVGGNLSCLWEVDGIPAELGHDVLPEDDNLLRAVLHPGRVGEELGLGDILE